MISSVLTVIVLTGLAAASAALYLLPVLIGRARRVPDLGAVVVVNVLLGWTFIGWAAALAMALAPSRPAVPVIQVVENLPPSPPPAPDQRGAGWAGPPGPPPLRTAPAPPLVLPDQPGTPASPASQP